MSAYTLNFAGLTIPLVTLGENTAVAIIKAGEAAASAAAAASSAANRVPLVPYFASIGTFAMAAGSVVETSGYTVAGKGGGRYVADATANAALAAAHPLFCIQSATAGVYARLIPDDGITAEQGGAGLGGTNDGQIMTSAFHYMRLVAGSGDVELSAGRTYTVNDLATQAVGTALGFVMNAGNIFIPPGCRIKANGATLRASTSVAAIYKGMAEVLTSHIVTGAMALGVRVFQLGTIGEATQFAGGDWCLWRLGDISYDLPETYVWGWSKVESINAGTGQITLEKGIRRAWDGTGTNNRRIYRCVPLKGQILDDARFAPFSAAVPAQQGIQVYYGGLGLEFGAIRGTKCRAGTLALQYTEDFHAQYVEARDNPELGANQGQGMRFAESTGRIETAVTSNCAQQALVCEAASDISVGYHRDHNVATTARTICYANGRSNLTIDRGLYTGIGGNALLTHQTADGGKVRWRDLRCEYDVAPGTLPLPGWDVDRLELLIGTTEEIYDSARAIEWDSGPIFLTDSMNASILGPAGAVTELRGWFGGPQDLLVTQAAVQADFATFLVGRQSNGGNSAVSIIPTVGQYAEVDLMGAFMGSAARLWGSAYGAKVWTGRALPFEAIITTGAGPGLSGSGKWVRLRGKFVPNILATAGVGWATRDMGRQTKDYAIENSVASAALNVSIGAGAGVSQTVPLTGIVAGDFVSGSFSVALNAGLSASFEAVAAGCKISLFNPTAAAIAGPAGTLYAAGHKRRLGV